MTPSQRPLIMASLLFGVGALIAIQQMLHLNDLQQSEKVERFNALIDRATTQLVQRMLSYEHGLRGARGVVITPGLEGITRAKFLEYSQSREYGREFPGSRGYGFIRRVPEQQEAAFLEAARADGKPDFQIRQITPHKGDRLVIQYIEPEANNREAVGLDIASETNRFEAALESVRNNQPTLTHPITLVQATEKPHYGFLLLLPIYQSGFPIQTPEERLQAFGGLAYNPLLIDEVLTGFDFRNNEFAMTIYDVDGPTPQEGFYTSPAAHQPAVDGLTKQVPLTIYGRHWQLEIKALTPFVTELNFLVPSYLGWGLVGLFSLLSVLLYVYLSYRVRKRQSLLDQAHLAAIVESSNDAIISKTLDGVVTSWNKAAEKIFGYTAEEAIGQPVAALIIPNNLQGQEAEILAKIRKGQALPYFSTIRHCKDGTQLDVSITLSPIYSTDGKVIGASKTIHDITEQKNAQHQLEQLNQALRERTSQAEAANRTKSEFLANMSHEIRTPMNAILGLCYLLEKQSLQPSPRDMVQKIQSAARSLLNIINDILDFSKIEAKRLEIRHQPFQLDSVLNNLASIMSTAVGNKPIEVVIAPAPSGAEYLKGDAQRLEQILINLTGNALKFTDAGEVTLSIRVTEIIPLQNKVVLRFSVRDTGIGIPKEKQDVIFKAFSQVDGSNTRAFGGTGLGLTISRRLAELMGGNLSLVSELGQGSEFILDIPFECSSPAQNIPQEIQHQHVLIADDHPTALIALAETATNLGWCADMVESGRQAIELTRHPAGKPYDLLLLDWRMPTLDGLATAQQIRQQKDLNTSPIIIMVTAYDREQLQAQPGSEAVDVILTKPVTTASLYNAVLEAKKRRGQIQKTLTDTPSPSTQRLAGIRVLVVDDSDINREVAEQILHSEGAQVSLAINGQEALHFLNEHPKAVDVVLMDVQMPVMDGYEATRKIRASSELHHLPVAALTAGAFNSQRDAAFQAGMNAFIAKPFDVDDLIKQVQQLAQNPHGSSSTPEQPHLAPDEPDAAFVSAHPLMANTQLAHPINVERGLAIFKDSVQYKYFLRKFATDYQNCLTVIPQPTSEALAALLHKMKGAAGNLGLMELALNTNEAEKLLQAKAPLADVLTSAQNSLERALAFIADYAPAPQEPLPEPTAPQLPTEQLTDLLNQLMGALDTDNPDRMDPIIEQLSHQLPNSELQSIRQSVENFDFRGAERIVRAVASRLGLVLDT